MGRCPIPHLRISKNFYKTVNLSPLQAIYSGARAGQGNAGRCNDMLLTQLDMLQAGLKLDMCYALDMRLWRENFIRQRGQGLGGA